MNYTCISLKILRLVVAKNGKMVYNYNESPYVTVIDGYSDENHDHEEEELLMRQKKLLSKVLSVLLSGAMIAGSIPAAAFAEEDEAPVYEEVAGAAGFHTLDGYVSEWSYSFEKGFNGTSWTSEDKDEDTYCWFVSQDKFHCGSKSMMSRSWVSLIGTLSSDNWLYSPLIQLSEDKEYQLTFNAQGKDNTFGVFIAVGRYNYDDYVQLGSDYTITDTEWNEYTIDLSEYAGKFIHLAFVHHNSTSTQNLCLDCVDISGRPKGYTMTRSWGFEDTVFDGESLSADVPKSFIAADKDKDGDTWEVIKADWYAHSGDCSVRARGSADVMDNWLRLPKLWLDIDKDYLLTFYVTDSFAYQTVDVYLYGDKCCDGNVTPEDLDGDEIPEYFSKVLTEDIAIVGKVSGWHEVKVDLSDYAGQYVYAAIVQHGGKGEMRVDDIALWQRDAHTPDGDRTNKYFEGFENEDGKLPDGWETYNKDGDIYNWKAYYGVYDKKHHGKGYVYSESYKGGAITPDNWLVMPSYTVSTTKITTLTFEAVGSHFNDYNEVFGVFISVDGGEFRQIGKDYTTSYVWQEVEVDLTPYAGKSVRVAVVHHNCTNQELLILDCFNIWEEPFPPIEKIDVTVDRPMVGETVPISTADYAKLTAASYDITCDSNACIWMKTSKKNYETIESPVFSLIVEDETFSTDYVYALVANFQLDEGYSFTDTVKITVNGITHSCKVIENHNKNIIAVRVEFYPLEAYITNVAVTVTEPVIGAVPDYAPTVVTTPDKTFEYMAAWAKALKEDYTTLTETDWDEIKDPTEKFAEGYVYTMAFLMGTHALPQYEFSPDVTVSINGKPALSPTESYCYTPSELYAYAVFDLSSTKPQNVKATPGDGKVTLTWDKVTGATKYATYYYLDGKYTSAGQTTGTTLTVKNLTNGTKYGFLVIAYVNGSWSSYTTADLVYAAPAAPNPVFTATPGNGQVTLNWSAVTGATKYATYYYLDGKYTSAGQTTGTTLTVKGLTNGTKYGFLVIAYVDGAWTSFTTADLVYATPVASNKPVFTATPGNGQVTLNWSAVTGATKYATYYYLGGKYTSAGQTTGTSLAVKGLTNGTKYGFLVIAYVGGAWTSYTTADLVYATPVASKPVVTATPGNGQVTLNWSAVTGATKYATYYYLDGKYTSAGQTTGTSLTVKNLTNGTKYGFLVIAYVGGAWTTYTTADLVYATPVGSSKPVFTATPGNGQVTLNWSAVTGATKYATYYYLDGKYTSAGQTTGTSLTVKGLTNGTKCGFLVIAYVDGAWTSYTTADLVYATPVGSSKPVFTATPGNGQVTLNWSAVTGATKYATYYYLGGKYTAAGQTTGTSLTVKGLTNGTKYGFLVIAYVGGAWTSYTTADLVYATPVGSNKPVFTATPGDGQVTLNWSAVTGATKYATYYYLGGKYTAAGQTTGTSLTVKGLTNGTKYGFLVIAYVDGAWTSYTTADLVYATPK